MIVGFIYDDVSSKDMGVKARLTSWQVSGTLRNYSAAIPGKYGVADFGADMDAREIPVSCSIFPKLRFSDLVETLDGIALWLSPVNGLKQLIFDDVPDRYFMARLKDKVDCERIIRAAGVFELSFYCPDPFAYALEDEVFTIMTTGQSTVTRSLGNIESRPVYYLKGSLTKGAENYISISVGGIEMKIVNAELSTGEILAIDTEKMTAYVEDGNGFVLRNALPYLQELNFPELAVGENSILIEAVNGTFSELEIKARSRWR
jgi:predicted phage tail component-like protein